MFTSEVSNHDLEFVVEQLEILLELVDVKRMPHLLNRLDPRVEVVEPLDVVVVHLEIFLEVYGVRPVNAQGAANNFDAITVGELLTCQEVPRK